MGLIKRFRGGTSNFTSEKAKRVVVQINTFRARSNVEIVPTSHFGKKFSISTPGNKFLERHYHEFPGQVKEFLPKSMRRKGGTDAY